jgi:hypothetical protein
LRQALVYPVGFRGLAEFAERFGFAATGAKRQFRKKMDGPRFMIHRDVVAIAQL